MGISDHITYLLRNLYACKEATVRTRHGAIGWFKIGKGVCEGSLLSPCLFNLYANYIMQNARLYKSQTGIKIARRNVNNLRYTDDTTLMAQRGTKSPLDKGERWERKAVLKSQHSRNEISGSWSHQFMVNRWGKSGSCGRFYLGGSNITADHDCSHEIKRCLLLGRKPMINLVSILESRDITVLTKVHIANAMVFPVVLYGCESWTIKKTECRRIDAF